jgi:hypothetical protein
MIFGFCPECHAVLQDNGCGGSGHFPYCAIVQREIDLLRLEMQAVTVPTQNDFDWGSLTVHAVERLRAPKTAPVPDAIVKLAQQSYEGIVNPKHPEGERLHVLRHTFESEARASQFAKLMRKAGSFTSPITSVTVVVDPDDLKNEEGGRTIAWRTGTRRGKAAA